jgi:DNA segregation ATPase FtsK/SpoIIIE-like protein
MTTLKNLEERIQKLEDRLNKIEDRATSSLNSDDKELMEAFYNKAKELVLKYHKASPIFLQKKLFIDYVRASKIMDKLRADGVLAYQESEHQ